MTVCPHGDPICPCPDGDACHYEGSFDSAGDYTQPWPCPNPPPLAPCEHLNGGDSCSTCATLGGCPAVRADRQHCHVEGCRWESEGCGLARLGLSAEGWAGAVELPTWHPAWACGAQRAAKIVCDSLGW